MRKTQFINDNGFFSLQFLLFVILITITLYSYSSLFFAQKQKDLFQKACYFDLADLQRDLVQSEKKLFELNPASNYLRLRLKILYAELGLAIISKNAALIAKIGLEIKNTISLQQKLDKAQRLIILSAKNHLNLGLLNIQQKLNSGAADENLIWSSLINSKQIFSLGQNTILAIQTDSIGGLAPNYQLLDDYRTSQEMTLKLQLSLRNKPNQQRLIKTNQQFEFLCKVSFTKKVDQWDLEINQDKF